ncbi:hypothetical protein ACFXJ8_34515 [Nonomuraea sp. NPDC059194]|uniref:hypothetical protein n=1 Tax=Nonomuraea sp. NPDC059194 TaxID=3346764 RepID=UPI0036BFA337
MHDRQVLSVLMRELVARVDAAGVLRPDATAMDISLLIEQLGRSSLIEQLDRQGRGDLTEGGGTGICQKPVAKAGSRWSTALTLSPVIVRLW